MTNNNRFFIGSLKVAIGEYETHPKVLLVANSEKRAWHVLDRAAASYYGSADMAEEDHEGDSSDGYNPDGYEANGGEICTSVHGVAEISLPTFLELRSNLSVYSDVNVKGAHDSVEVLSLDGFKAFARSAGRSLEKQGIDAPQTGVLNAMSVGLGQKNWQVLRVKLDQLDAILREGPLVVKPFPGSVEVPELEIDAFMLKKYGTQVSPNGRLERRIVANLFAHLEKNGFQVVALDDTDELQDCAGAKAAMELIFNLDTAYVHVSGPDRSDIHIIQLEVGNGVDMVVDYTFTEGDADGFQATMGAFDAQAYA